MGWGFLFKAVITAFSFVYQRKMQKKAARKAAEAQRAAAEAAKGFRITSSGEPESLPLVYGRAAIGGVRVYANTVTNFTSGSTSGATVFANGLTSSQPGDAHQFLITQQVLCLEGINGALAVKVDDESSTISRFGFGQRIIVRNNGGTADPTATANGRSANARFTGAAFATNVFKLDRDNPQYQGIPDVQYLIEGMKVYTITRVGEVYSLSGSKTYTNNPAYCLLDYLMNATYGKGIALADIDLKTFWLSAQVCDQAQQFGMPKNGLLWAAKGGLRDIKLYELNVALDTNDDVRSNIEVILQSMGDADLVWTSGKFRLNVSYPGIYGTDAVFKNAVMQAGSGVDVHLWRSLVETNTLAPGVNGEWERVDTGVIDDDIILDEPLSSVWPTSQNRLNYCTITFLNESEDFKEDSVSWPPKGGAVHTTYLAQDSGVPLEDSQSPAFISDEYHALAFAEQQVRQSRDLVSVNIGLTLDYWHVEPGDFLHLVSEVLNIPGELYKVASVEVSERGYLKCELSKFDALHLAWNAKDDEVVASRNIYDFFFPQVTNLTYTSNAIINPDARGRIDWDYSTDSRITRYHIKYTTAPIEFVSESTIWIDIVTTGNNYYEFDTLPGGSYTIAVVAASATQIAPQYNNVLNSYWPTISIGTGRVLVDGNRLFFATVYQNSASQPATPVGGVFNLDTFSFNTLPASWAALPPLSAVALWKSDGMIREQVKEVWLNQARFQDATFWGTVNGAVTLNTDYTADINYSGAFAGMLQLSGYLFIGRYYEYTFQVENYVSGNIAMYIGNTPVSVSSDGVYTGITIADGSGLLQLGTAAFVGTVSNWQVNEIEHEAISWSTPININNASNWTIMDPPLVAVSRDADGNNVGYDLAKATLKAVLSNVEVTLDNATDYAIVNAINVTATINNIDSDPEKGLITVTDLIGDLGSVEASVTFGGNTFNRILSVAAFVDGSIVDTTPPPAPLIGDFTITAGLGVVFIDHNVSPQYTEGRGHDHVNMYYTDTLAETFTTAKILDEFSRNFFSVPAQDGTERAFYFTYVSKDGGESLPSPQYDSTTPLTDAVSVFQHFYGSTTSDAFVIAEAEAIILAQSDRAPKNYDVVTITDSVTLATWTYQYQDPDWIVLTNIIDGSLLVTGAVTTDKIAANAITAGSGIIANAAITDALIADLSADKITAGSIGASEYISAGDLLKLSGEGWIESYSASPFSTAADYVRLDSGNLRVYKYIPALGDVVLYNQLSRVESGVGDNNVNVVIPGYWSGQPKVIASPNSLQFYESSYYLQDQSVNIQVNNLAETGVGSRIWEFTPVATLNFSSASGTTTINASDGSSSGNINGTVYTTNANCLQVTVNCTASSQRGTGSAPNYYYRACAVALRYRVTSVGGAYSTSGTATTISMGAQFGSVAGNFTFVFPAGANQYDMYLQYTYYDSGGTFSIGGPTYEEAVDSTSNSGTSSSSTALYTASGGIAGYGILKTANSGSLNIAAYSLPGGWYIHNIAVSYQVAAYCVEYTANNGTYAVSWTKEGSQIFTTGNSGNPSTDGNSGLTTWRTTSFSNGTTDYTSARASVRTYNGYDASHTGQVEAQCRVRSFTRTVTRRRTITNSTTASNAAYFSNYNFTLTAGLEIATGTLNWLAIGD